MSQPGNPEKPLSRRLFLSATGVAGTVLVLGAGPAVSTPGLSNAHQAVVSRIAAVGSVLPYRLPGLGTPGSGVEGHSAERITAQLGMASAEQVALVQSGAETLAATGVLTGDDEAVARGIGELVAAVGGPTPELVATVALAVATVSSRLAPHADDAAALWLDHLHRTHGKAAR